MKCFTSNEMITCVFIILNWNAIHDVLCDISSGNQAFLTAHLELHVLVWKFDGHIRLTTAF